MMFMNTIVRFQNAAKIMHLRLWPSLEVMSQYYEHVDNGEMENQY